MESVEAWRLLVSRAAGETGKAPRRRMQEAFLASSLRVHVLRDGLSPEEADSLRVVQGGLDRGVNRRGMARAAQLIQAYELVYWDTLYEASRQNGRAF